MEFHSFHAQFDRFRQAGKVAEPDDFLKEVESQVRAQVSNPDQRAVEILRYYAEHNWIVDDRPYFNVWPAAIHMLTNVGIDVPASFLRCQSALKTSHRSADENQPA